MMHDVSTTRQKRIPSRERSQSIAIPSRFHCEIGPSHGGRAPIAVAKDLDGEDDGKRQPQRGERINTYQSSREARDLRCYQGGQ